MKIRLIKKFRHYEPNREIGVTNELAKELIAAGIAKAIVRLAANTTEQPEPKKPTAKVKKKEPVIYNEEVEVINEDEDGALLYKE